MKTLVIDVGGTHVKILLEGVPEKRRFISGPALTPVELVARVHKFTVGWSYERVSLGYPGVVRDGQIVAEPHNLGPGWTGFDFVQAFGTPVRLINDAAMQALGGYDGGRMLFLGFGTGLGTTLIIDGLIVPMELGRLPYKKGGYEDYVGDAALKKKGKTKWRRHVFAVINYFQAALQPDYTLLGGGNTRLIEQLPTGCRRGNNDDAFTGGFRLWSSATTYLNRAN